MDWKNTSRVHPDLSDQEGNARLEQKRLLCSGDVEQNPGPLDANKVRKYISNYCYSLRYHHYVCKVPFLRFDTMVENLTDPPNILP